MVKIPKIGEIFVEIFANNNRLRASLAQASSLIRDWSLIVTGLTAGISNAFAVIADVGIKAVTIALIGLTGTFALVAKSGAEFQDNITRAFVIMQESSGATGQALKQLTDEAIRLGSETLFSATQAAEGLQTLARAGFSVGQAISAIGPILNLAIVGNIELAEASNIATASMFGFALEAKEMTRVSDVLSLASSQANTTISLLGSALGFVAPVAQSAGISLEETASAIGVLSNAGIRGSRAGTTLRRALSILLAPTGRAKKIFDELGISFNSAEGGLISFTKIIAKLNKANLTAAETQTIFGRIAGPGMAALLRQGSGALADLTGKLENSQGAADRMSQAFRTTVKGRVRDLGASVVNLGLAFSEKFNKPLADTIFSIRNFVKVNTEALQGMGTFEAIIRGVISAFKPFTDLIKIATMRFQNFLRSLSPEKVLGFFNNLRKRVQSFVNVITSKEFKETIKNTFDIIISLGKNFVNILKAIVTAWSKLPDSIRPTATAIAIITVGITSLMGGILNIIILFISLGALIKGLALGRMLGGFLASRGAVAGTVTLLQVIAKLIPTIGAIIAGIGILNMVKDTGAFQDLLITVKNIIVDIGAGVTIVTEKIKEWFKNSELVQTSLNVLKQIFEIIIRGLDVLLSGFDSDKVKKFVESFSGLKESLSKLGEILKNALFGAVGKVAIFLKESFLNAINSLKESMSGIANRLFDELEKGFPSFVEFLTNAITEGIKNGIENAKKSAKSFITGDKETGEGNVFQKALKFSPISQLAEIGRGQRGQGDANELANLIRNGIPEAQARQMLSKGTDATSAGDVNRPASIFNGDRFDFSTGQLVNITEERRKLNEDVLKVIENLRETKENTATSTGLIAGLLGGLIEVTEQNKQESRNQKKVLQDLNSKKNLKQGDKERSTNSPPGAGLGIIE